MNNLYEPEPSNACNLNCELVPNAALAPGLTHRSFHLLHRSVCAIGFYSLEYWEGAPVWLGKFYLKNGFKVNDRAVECVDVSNNEDECDSVV